VTHGARTCPIGDMVPRRRESSRVVWRNCRVAPSVVMRLMALPACTACPPVTSEQAARLSRAIPLGTTGHNLNRRTHSSSSHSQSHISHSLSLSLSLSLSREDLLAPVSSPPPPGSVEPPFVTTAGRRPHRRLLSTSNRVDLSLT
jgi:hypothetical protein